MDDIRSIYFCFICGIFKLIKFQDTQTFFLVHNHQHPADVSRTRDMEQCLYADLFRTARRDVEQQAKQFE